MKFFQSTSSKRKKTIKYHYISRKLCCTFQFYINAMCRRKSEEITLRWRCRGQKWSHRTYTVWV